ncbi:MAG: hypothetical protein A2Z30_01370 [Chloroflexi bacterium RBG_16_64_43]|nr:MAG: hypothetical protein A2Z30_01370 [Chloroflexi bacterium RBG_16_64_43]
MGERVECHSGFTYAERPLALNWHGTRYEVAAVEAQWRIPGGTRFRVRTTAGARFELLYVELHDEWRVHPLEPAADESHPPTSP